MDAQVLKEILSAPLALLALMYLGSLFSALTQLAKSQRSGGEPPPLSSYLRYWPETLTVVIGNVIAFAILVLTDQLNFTSALGVGFGLNSVTDLIRPTGRSASLQPSNGQGGFVQLRMLGVLLAVAIVGLTACASQTFNQTLARGYSTVTTARNSATILLTTQSIGSDDAENALEQTDNFRAGLDIARDIHAADPTAGEDRLQTVMLGLVALDSYLCRRRGGTYEAALNLCHVGGQP